MAQPSILFTGVSFRYDTQTAPLLDELTVHVPAGWTGIVGANGAGKTTLLKLATGLLVPQRGTVRLSGEAIYCPQRTDEPPGLLAGLLEATDGDACAIRGRLGVSEDWPERWETLSHGERKRAQIAVALWRGPQVLALDEPTNHIDREARRLGKRNQGGFSGQRGEGLGQEGFQSGAHPKDDPGLVQGAGLGRAQRVDMRRPAALDQQDRFTDPGHDRGNQRMHRFDAGDDPRGLCMRRRPHRQDGHGDGGEAPEKAGHSESLV